MRAAAILGGVILILSMLRDAFETMILPRRLSSRFRFARGYYRVLWPAWAFVGRRALDGRKREGMLSLFGPLSLLWLFALWAIGMIFGFALIYFGAGSPLHTGENIGGFAMDLYLSGSTFFTLGLGDVVPLTSLGRVLDVAESGLGFSFLAVIIGYLPVLYQGFSNRETAISMLDARAGSPPSASELLRRHVGAPAQLEKYLAEWERWSAELLERQISYPVLGFFRSQHVNQSWLAALTTLLDACAFSMAAGETSSRQAELTFAMARHAVVDLAQIFIRALRAEAKDRLPPENLDRLCLLLREAGMPLTMDEERRERLTQLRRLYEPHVQAISIALMLELPAWIGNAEALDNWQRSPWDRPKRAALRCAERSVPDRHY